MINHSQKIRTPLELWLLVEKHFNDWVKTKPLKIGKDFSIGLCFLIKDMRIFKILNIEEREFLLNEIKIYAEGLGVFGHKFIWEAQAVEPRAEFIQEQILKAIRA